MYSYSSLPVLPLAGELEGGLIYFSTFLPLMMLMPFRVLLMR